MNNQRLLLPKQGSRRGPCVSDILALKVERTPTFYVNGRPLTEYGPQELMDLVASELQRTKAARLI